MRFHLLTAAATLLLAALTASAQPIPSISQPLVPATKAPGGRGFTLTVNGSGFSSNSVVEWNGHARRTVFVSDTQLTAKIEPADIATASTASVTVFTPGHLKHISTPVFFQVTTPEATLPFQSSITGLSGVLAAAVDVNGDGLIDLIMLPGNAGSYVSVALGTGGGQFGAAQNYPVNGVPASLATGDFDGDGTIDLAVATTSGLEILYNAGSGTFGAPETISDIYFDTLATGDFNGDGRLDLIAGRLNPSNYAVYAILHKRGTGFAAPVPYAVVSPEFITVGDFNGDNILDVAVLNDDDSISVLIGNGDGTFLAQDVYQTGAQGDFPTGIIAADFNGDGKLDLVRAASLDTAGAGILLGNGDGTFQAVQIFHGSSYQLAAGDFNGDGKLDLAVGANGANLGILIGNGNGGFEPVQYFFNSPFQGVVLGAGDFNQNGRLDLVLGNYSQIELMLQ